MIRPAVRFSTQIYFIRDMILPQSSALIGLLV